MTAETALSICATAQTTGGGLLRKLSHLTDGKLLSGQVVRVGWSVDGVAALSGITALLLAASAVSQPAVVKNRPIEEVKEDRRNRFILIILALVLAAFTSAVVTQRYLPNMFGVKA